MSLIAVRRGRAAALAALVAGAVAAAGCGGDSEPAASTSKPADKASAPAAGSVDRAFLAEMIPHHRSAVDMARMARERATSPFVAQLATAIIETQQAEISTMRAKDRTLADAGVKRGSLGLDVHAKGMHGDVGSLRDVKRFDAAFLRMMIPHHEGAIEMAAVELEEGRDPELKALAQDIIDAQLREIEEMQAHLQAGADPGALHHAH